MKAEGNQGSLWVYLKVWMSTIGAGSLVGIVSCVSVFKCVHAPLKWMKSMQKVKQQCHSCLAWSEVRWMAGAAPESCFSHTVSASVSTAIHLLWLSASPCPLPPQALLTEAMDTGSCSQPLRRNTPPRVAGDSFFLCKGAERQKKRGFR